MLSNEVYKFTDCNGLGKCEVKITQGDSGFQFQEETQKEPAPSNATQKADPLSSALGKGLSGLGKFGKK